MKGWQWQPDNLKVASGLLMVLAVLAWCFCWAAPVWADEANITASLDPMSFSVDQAAQLTVQVTGSSSAEPELPKVDGLRFFPHGQSSRMQWINGSYSSSVSYLYMVQADRAGTYVIPPIKATVDGKVLQTDSITCTVQPAGPAAIPPGAGQGGGIMAPGGQTRLRSGESEKIGFMRIILKKKTAYVGELVPMTIKAYFRQGIQATINSEPHITGESFVLQHRAKKPLQTEELVNGIPYSVLTWNDSISGVKAGKFPLEVDLGATLLVRQQVVHPSGMFGSPFFGDAVLNSFFGGGYKKKRVKLVGPKRSLTILDLPEKGRPANFGGAIGTFSLLVSVKPTTAKVGDPLTLKMVVTGTGNFDRVEPPVFPVGGGWKTYTPSSEFKDLGNGRGRKKFEQAIVPTSSSLRAVPSVSFTYFDPGSRQYVTLKSDAIALHLQGNGPAAAVATPAQPAPAPAAPEKKKTGPPPEKTLPAAITPAATAGLAPLETDLGVLSRRIIPTYKKSWFIGWIGISLLLLATGWFLRLRRQRLLADPSILQRRDLDRKLKHHYQEMEQALAAGDSDRFLQSCRAAIQDRLGLAWQQEARAITLAALQERLAAGSPLITVFQQAEHGSYVGIHMDREEMRSTLNLVRKELEKVS
ncbi:MAG TPA: protein BatD [Desulfobacteraceae bacterium]|nr:protein BatD [Desulfobacteraceae bacterium]